MYRQLIKSIEPGMIVNSNKYNIGFLDSKINTDDDSITAVG